MGLIYSVYSLIQEKSDNIGDIWQKLEAIISPENTPKLAIVLLLMPINWAFEAWKWQKLASKVEKISFQEAYKGVLAGLSLSVITPIMLGDFTGKILLLKSDKRLQSIGAILLGNAVQLYVSLFFGSMSYLFFVFWVKPTPIFFHLSANFLLIIALIFGLFLGLNLSKIDTFSTKNKLFNYLKHCLIILKHYDTHELRNILLVATARYLVFSLQFLIMLNIFRIHLPIYVLLAGIGMVFLAKTLASTLNFLGDLSVRAFSSIYYFSFFGVQTSLIASATLTIWLINVLLPIVVGSIFVLQLSFSTKNS